MNLLTKPFISSLGLVCLACTVSAQTVSFTSIVTSGTGFSRPVSVATPPGDTRVYVVEQRTGTVGRIRHVTAAGVSQPLASPFFTISPVSTGSEQGLLGLAFHPNYQTNRYFYVNYTNSAGTTVIARYTAAADGNSTVAGSGQTVLTISQPFNNHNGGTLRFGPDGYLYIGMGDGGSSNDPGNRSQNLNELLGKFLRIDVDTDDFPVDPNKNYGIPASNPFVGVAGLDEIWSWGWRNPWKFAFDPRSRGGFDGLVVGDVGQLDFEELNYELPGAGGQNYGWRTYEANSFTGLNPLEGPYTFPFYEYDHGVGISVTGGFVYRGVRLGPSWYGRYLFIDYGAGTVWSMPLNINGDTGAMTPGALIAEASPVLGFGIAAIEPDPNGEPLYLSIQNNLVRRMAIANPWRAVSGTVNFEGVGVVFSPPKWALFEFRDAANNPLYSLNVGLPADGSFRLPAPNGAFKLSIKHKNWLRRTVDVTLASGDVSGVSLSCINGDVDGDNEITNADYSIWAAKNGLLAGDPLFDPLCDLDQDGEITNADYSIWAFNNGILGDD